MTVSIRSRVFLLTALLPLLRLQLADWLARTHWWLRFTVAAISGWLAMAFAGFLTQLPSGWFDAVAARLLSVSGVFVAFVLLLVATTSFALGVLSAKAARSL